MEIQLTTDQEAKLSRLAADKGCDPNVIAQAAIDHYLEEEERFIAAVNLGEAELERGEYLTHEEVGARLERMLGS
jgi:predicted transcriptional regulator